MPKWVIVEFDRERTVRIATLLEEMWLSRKSPFDDFFEPERQYMPKMFLGDERLMRCWHFSLASINRFGKEAYERGRALSSLVVRKPYLIDPLDPKSLERHRFEVLDEVIPFARLEKYRARIDWWFDGLARIRDEHGGDPGNIILDAPYCAEDWRANRAAVIGRYSEFMGIKQKIGQLAAAYSLGMDWTERQDDWAKWKKVPFIATDVWIMRMAKQLGMISSSNTDIAEYVRDHISDYLCEICFGEDLNSHAVTQALWHLGTIVCGKLRRNRKLRPRSSNYRHFCAASCPAYSFCQGVIPANYDKTEDGRIVRSRSLKWNEMIPHPPLP